MASTIRDRRRNSDDDATEGDENQEQHSDAQDSDDSGSDDSGSNGSGSKNSGSRGSKPKSKRPQSKSRAARVKSAHIITEHIDVGVPAQVAYDQWTQYDKWSEMFKKESADTGRRNRHGAKGSGAQGQVKVRAKIGPSERQFTAEVVGVEPGRRISWRSKGPVQAMGTTSFHRLDDRLTHLMVQVEYKPTGFLEVIGNFFRMQRRRVRRDLRLFKHYIELRGEATGKGPRRPAGEGLRKDVDRQDSGARSPGSQEEK